MGHSPAATLLSLAMLLVMPRCHSGALSMQHGPVGKPVGAQPSSRTPVSFPLMTKPKHRQKKETFLRCTALCSSLQSSVENVLFYFAPRDQCRVR